MSTDEMECLTAFGEMLVEGRTLAPTERRYLTEHIEDRMRRSPESLVLYRTAAKTLDRLAGRRFQSLEVSERLDLIARHRLAGRRGPSGNTSDPSSPETLTLRTRIVPDLIRGYYTSPAGWSIVGYEAFPGRCGDLARYTRAES